MEKIAVSVEQEQLYKIQAIQHIHGIDSRSAAVRWFIDEYDTVQSEYEELNTKYEQLQTEVDRLKNEKQTIVEQREENTELVEYVEQEKTAQQQYREAGLLGKVKFTLFGMDSDEE
jgi:predicted  nucleic acid-binding Zn-ribbon protein